MNFLINLHIKISNLKFGFFVITMLLISKIGVSIVGGIYEYITKISDNTFQHSGAFVWLGAILLAPIIETAISQALVYEILQKIPFTKEHNVRIVLIGGLLFSLLHSYSIGYILAIIPAGLVFMYAYVVRLKKDDAFLSVWLIHFLFNLISFITYYWNSYIK